MLQLLRIMVFSLFMGVMFNAYGSDMRFASGGYSLNVTHEKASLEPGTSGDALLPSLYDDSLMLPQESCTSQTGEHLPVSFVYKNTRYPRYCYLSIPALNADKDIQIHSARYYIYALEKILI